MNRKRVSRLGLLAAMALSLGVGAARGEDYGAVLAGARSVFWNSMEKGVKQAGTEIGIQVIVRGTTDDDPQTASQNLQMRMVRSLLDFGVKGLVLAPIPVHGLPTPIELSVPVVFVDRPSTDYKSATTVATDNYAAGRVAGLTLKGHVEPGAKIAVLRLSPDVVSTTARETGFIDAVKELGFEVAVDAFIGHGIYEPRVAAEQALRAYDRPLDAVFTPTDFTTVAALRAVADLQLAKRPKMVGFDYRPAFEQYMRSGELHAFVAQDAYQMGYQAMRTLADVLAGRPVPPMVAVDTLVVTLANLDNPRVRTGLLQYHE
jgi:ribose transport system substrate-binding protein